MDNTAAWLNQDPQSPTAEGFKALRTNLMFAAEERDCRMILLMPPPEGPVRRPFRGEPGGDHGL